MKHYICLILTVIYLCGNAQSIKYLSIPGTKVQLSAPGGYKVADSFYGLQKNKTTGIQVYESTETGYYSRITGFTKEELTAKGAKVYSFKDVKVSGYPARFTTLQGDTGYKVSSVIFGDSTFSVMLIGAYPANDAVLEKQVEQSLLTAKYNKGAKVELFALSYFKLNDAGTKFKYAKTTADNMYIYAQDGKVLDSYMAESALTAMPIVVDSTTDIEQIGVDLLNDMEKYGLNEAEVKFRSSKPINGFKAYEAIIYGKVAKEMHAVYHMVVVKGNKGLIMQGIALQDHAKTIEEFEALAHTVSAK